MGYDKSYHQTGMMAYDRILVNMDTIGGLYEHITIQWRDSALKQIIDYEGILYRCHKVGHLYRDCPFLRKGAGKGKEAGVVPPLDTSPNQQPLQQSEPQMQAQDGDVPPNSPAAADTVTAPEAPLTSTTPVHSAQPEDAANSGMSPSPPSLISHASCTALGISSPPSCSSPLPSLSQPDPLTSSHSPLTCSLPLPRPLAPPLLITSTLASLSIPLSHLLDRLRSRMRDKGPDAVGLDPMSIPSSLRTSRGPPSFPYH